MEGFLLTVGRLPPTKRSAEVRRVLRQALDEYPFLCVDFADDATRLDNVRPLLDMAFIALFDASRSRSVGSFLDLGYALGQRRFCVVLQGVRPADLSGYPADHTVTYSSLGDLRDTLESSVVEWVGRAVRKYTAAGEVFANMDARLLGPLGCSVLQADLDDEFTTASAHGFSEEQVGTTLGILTGLGWVRATESGWTMTEVGRRQLPRLIAGMDGSPSTLRAQE